MQYYDGAVTVVNGSPIVTGEDTLFLTNVSIGNTFKVKSENVFYIIQTVDSNTQITLTANYAGASDTDVSYIIARDFTPNLNLPEIAPGDRDWSTHMTQGLRIIDNLLGPVYAVQTLTTSGFITIDWLSGAAASMTLTLAATTFTLSSGINGRTYKLKLSQDGSGNRRAGWSSAINWENTMFPTLTTTANKTDILTFFYMDSAWFGSISRNFGLKT